MTEQNKSQDSASKEKKPTITKTPAEQTPTTSQNQSEKPATPTTPATPDHPVNEKLFSSLAYVPVLVLFLQLVSSRPKTEYCRFHTKQGFAMTGAFIAVLVTMAIFSIVRIPFLGGLLFLTYFVLTIYLMFTAYNNQKWEIPVLGKFAKKIDPDKLFVASTAPKAPDEKPAHPTEASTTPKPSATEEPKTNEQPTTPHTEPSSETPKTEKKPPSEPPKTDS